jgi:hypothetical protein
MTRAGRPLQPGEPARLPARVGLVAAAAGGAVPAGAAARALLLAALVALGAGALAVAGGCRAPDDRAAIQDRSRAKGTAQVVSEAAAATYVPPADGRLSAAQMQLYVDVRERESRIREAGAPAAADLRAAQELRVNPREYTWVRERVLEAEAAATTQALVQKVVAGREQLLAHMRRAAAAETDPVRRAVAEREIEDFRRGLQESAPVLPPAVRANMALLARFRQPLARLRVLEERALAAAGGP